MLDRINDTLLTRILTLAVLAGAVLAATGVLIFAPTAHADANGYINDMRNASYSVDEAGNEWLGLGYDVCQLEAAGVPSDLIASKIVATTGSGVYTADAYEIIGIANKDLCQGAAQSSSDFGPFKS